MRGGHGLELDDELSERIDELRIAREVDFSRGALHLQRLRVNVQHVAGSRRRVRRGSHRRGRQRARRRRDWLRKRNSQTFGAIFKSKFSHLKRLPRALGALLGCQSRYQCVEGQICRGD